MSNSSKVFKKRQVTLDNETFVVSIPAKDREQSLAEPVEYTGVPSDSADSVDEGSHPDLVELALGEVLNDAHVEAKNILDNARSSADAIIVEAYDQAEEIRAKAKEEGYREGVEDCERKCQANLDKELEELLLIREQLTKKERELYIDAETDIIGLVIDSVKKILGEYVTKDEEYIEELVKTALAKVTKSHKVVLRVSPDDVETAERVRTRLLISSDRIDEIQIKRDISLSGGQCIIETERGAINASIDGQLQKLIETFELVLAESRMDMLQEVAEDVDDQ